MSEGYTLKETMNKMLSQNAEMELRQIRLEQKLEQILEQAVKTNGRVTRVEEDVQKLKDQHLTAKAYATAVSVIIGAVWTVVNFIVK